MSSETEIIAERVARESGLPDLMTILGKRLQPTDLQSVLLSVYEMRAQSITAGDIWRQGRKQHFVQPCDIEQRELVALDHLILSTIDRAYSSLELSPLSPFGLNTAITNTNQKKILTTVRNTEVLSDLGTALALEACIRRQRPELKTGAIRLCSSQRAVRAQAYDPKLGFTPHFRIFGMLSAENENNFDHRFSIDNLYDHIKQYLTFFSAASAHGYAINDIVVTVSDISITEALIRVMNIAKSDVCSRTLSGSGTLFSDGHAPFETTLADPDEVAPEMVQMYSIRNQVDRLKKINAAMFSQLTKEFPNVTLRFCLDRIGGVGHYQDICFKIDGKNSKGDSCPLVDGGVTNWMAKILSNKKECCLVSGIGTELFCRLYKK